MENKQPTLLEGFFKGLLNNAVKDNKIDCDLVAAAYIFRHGMMAIECRGVLHRHQTGEVYPSSTRIGMEYQVPIDQIMDSGPALHSKMPGRVARPDRHRRPPYRGISTIVFWDKAAASALGASNRRFGGFGRVRKSRNHGFCQSDIYNAVTGICVGKVCHYRHIKTVSCSRGLDLLWLWGGYL